MPIPSKLLKGQMRLFDIEMLVTSKPATTRPGERQLLGLRLPPWQRPEVWTTEQKQRFIESIFLGLGCGYYVCNGLDWCDEPGGAALKPMAGWLLDGQQRLSAIRDFVELSLPPVFGDVTFATLTNRQRIQFLSEPFPQFELTYSDQEDVLKVLYDRLNFGGTPHDENERALPQRGG